MNTAGTNLFIVDSDRNAVNGLQQYLNNRFGTSLNISTFYTGESCLKKIDNNTGLVILAYFLDGIKGNEILKSIKLINPKTQVIMHSSNDDMGIAIDSFRKGATDYVVKGDNSWKKISSLVNKIVLYPVKILVSELGISKYLAMFILSFAGLGLIVFVWMKLI